MNGLCVFNKFNCENLKVKEKEEVGKIAITLLYSSYSIAAATNIYISGEVSGACLPYSTCQWSEPE